MLCLSTKQIESPDTDVLILIIKFYPQLPTKTSFQTGKDNQKRKDRCSTSKQTAWRKTGFGIIWILLLDPICAVDFLVELKTFILKFFFNVMI